MHRETAANPGFQSVHCIAALIPNNKDFKSAVSGCSFLMGDLDHRKSRTFRCRAPFLSPGTIGESASIRMQYVRSTNPPENNIDENQHYIHHFSVTD